MFLVTRVSFVSVIRNLSRTAMLSSFALSREDAKVLSEHISWQTVQSTDKRQETSTSTSRVRAGTRWGEPQGYAVTGTSSKGERSAKSSSDAVRVAL